MLEMIKTSSLQVNSQTIEAPLKNCRFCISNSTCLFQTLNKHQLNELSGIHLSKTKFKKGDVLLRIGDAYKGLFNIRAGFIKRDNIRFDGERNVATFSEPGSLFGFDGIEQAKYRLDAIALTDGELCNLNNNYLATLLQIIPEASEIINHYFSKSLNDLEDHLFSLGNHSAENKLLHFLYWFHKVSLKINPNKKSFELPMCRDDLRSYLGMTVETLSRSFSRIEDRGIIKVHNRVIEIIQFENTTLRLV